MRRRGRHNLEARAAVRHYEAEQLEKRIQKMDKFFTISFNANGLHHCKRWPKRNVKISDIERRLAQLQIALNRGVPSLHGQGFSKYQIFWYKRGGKNGLEVRLYHRYGSNVAASGVKKHHNYIRYFIQLS